ncbi:MAG: LamG domain-containing protein [Ruminococcaceae bacterium]|nr:LamG domain-containing protein [Oscillospiraceae bacterium]
MKQNLLRKSLSLLLGLCIILSSVGLTAFAQPDHNLQSGGAGLVPTTEIIFSEDFSSSPSLSAGSSWGTAPNTLSVFKNETTATIENGSLKVVGATNTEKSLNLKSDTTIKGKFAVEFNFKVVDNAATPLLFGFGYTDGTTEKKAIEIGLEEWVASDRFYRNLLYKDTDGTQKQLVDQTSSWRTNVDFHKWYLLHGDGNSWSTYSRDFYTLKVVADTNTSKYSVYLNGSLCLKDQSFADSSINWATTGVNLPFMMTTSDSDPLKYDNIKIYSEPQGRTTLYANDFNGYTEEVSWKGATSYATQRLSLFTGIAGLGLANMQSKGGYIYARNNALVTEYRNGAGGAFTSIIRMDDDMTIDMDFTVDSFVNDSYLDNYATVLVLTTAGADGIRFSVSKDGKFIYYYYNRTIPYEPTILTNITMDKPHHLTVHMNYSTYTCEVYVDGVLIADDMSLLYNTGKKGVTGYFKNGEDLTIGLGYHKESPTTDVTYDNIRVYRDTRENVLSDVEDSLAGIFSGTYVVKGNVDLPSSAVGYDGYNVKWTSNSSIIKVGSNGYSATVTPTEEEQVVKLTASVSDTAGEYTLTRSFNVVVPADETITDISSLTNWDVVSGTPLLAANPTNEADKAVNVVSSSEAYITPGTYSGIVEATAQLYMSKQTAGSIYLADDNGKAFAKVNLNRSVISAGEEGVIKSHSYPSKKWFDLTVKADMLKRTYDVFIDGTKVNNASIPFDEVSDNGHLARVGFTCSEGSVFVNDVTAKSLSANSGLEVKKISYKNSSAKVVNAPQQAER